MEAWRKKNIATLIVTGAVILGLFAFAVILGLSALSGSFHSLWGLVILLNINSN